MASFVGYVARVIKPISAEPTALRRGRSYFIKGELIALRNERLMRNSLVESSMVQV
jgi:hypothetical protein